MGLAGLFAGSGDSLTVDRYCVDETGISTESILSPRLGGQRQ